MESKLPFNLSRRDNGQRDNGRRDSGQRDNGYRGLSETKSVSTDISRQNRYICTKVDHPKLGNYHFTLLYFENITKDEIVAIRDRLNHFAEKHGKIPLGKPTKAVTTVFYNSSPLNPIREKMHEEVSLFEKESSLSHTKDSVTDDSKGVPSIQWKLSRRLDKYGQLVRIHLSVKGNQRIYDILLSEVDTLTTDGKFYTACGNTIDQ